MFINANSDARFYNVSEMSIRLKAIQITELQIKNWHDSLLTLIISPFPRNQLEAIMVLLNALVMIKPEEYEKTG